MLVKNVSCDSSGVVDDTRKGNEGEAGEGGVFAIMRQRRRIQGWEMGRPCRRAARAAISPDGTMSTGVREIKLAASANQRQAVRA